MIFQAQIDSDLFYGEVQVRGDVSVIKNTKTPNILVQSPNAPKHQRTTRVCSSFKAEDR